MSKLKLLLLVAALGGLAQNQYKIKHWLNPPPPHIPGSDKVVLYSTTWCGYCAKTRTFFAENHIDYQDIDVEHSPEGQAAYQKLGGNGVPIVVINDDTVIDGYAPDQLSEALAL